MTSADIIEQRVENFYDVKGGFCDWTFNAWGGLVDGLYFPWDNDDKVAGKICELEGVDRYRTEDFIKSNIKSYDICIYICKCHRTFAIIAS